MFSRISATMFKEITPEFIQSTRTTKGNTQVNERIVIEKVRSILTNMNLTFSEAGSQQPKDFRNINNTGLDIEVKKTDSMSVYFNDTCPCHRIYYIILFTGKEYKKTPDKNIPPQLLFLNGSEFIKDSPWLKDYIDSLEQLKDKYGRGEKKRKLSGIMSVYPRPTFKANISSFIKDK